MPFFCVCRKRACFGTLGSRPTRCLTCKDPDMIDITNKRCRCNKRPAYGYEGKQPICCAECKLNTMIDVMHPKCASGFCPTVSNPKYDNYCTHCFANMFPHDERTLYMRKKSKEIYVVSFITNKLSGWTHDKPLYVDIKGGCCNSKRRIDLRKMIMNTMLCVEIDEKQHKSYDKDDENDRYDNLFMDFSGKFIFIRYNPDRYRSQGRSRDPPFEERMNCLLLEIQRHTTRIERDQNRDLVEIHKLFFDN